MNENVVVKIVRMDIFGMYGMCMLYIVKGSLANMCIWKPVYTISDLWCTYICKHVYI